MQQASSVVVNILVNSNTTTANASFNASMQNIVNSATRAAKDSALSFNSIFGANFFADLAANMVRSMTTGFHALVREAVASASRLESAFTGLETIGKNVGLSKGDASESVKNLDLVRNGLLSVTDAATSVKNLLATGFSLPQAVELISRFGDTAAFGRQAALSFGQAIASATEGIKNQNSLLVDNAGVTKNLSVILKERGFQIQDLSDKIKGAAAREALYQGLIKETSLQLGDANRLLSTTQGNLTRAATAQDMFLASLGKLITDSALAKAGLAGITASLEFMTKHTGAVVAFAAAIGLVTVATIAAASGLGVMTGAQIANAISSNVVVASMRAVVASMLAVRTAATLTAGTIAVATAGFGAIALVVGALVYTFYQLSTAQKEQVKTTQEGISAIVQQRDAALENVKAITSLNATQNAQAETMGIVKTLYQGLNLESRARVDSAQNEAAKIATLRQEYDLLAKSRNQELQATGRAVTQNLLAKVAEFNDLQNRINQALQSEAAARRREAEFTANPRDTVVQTGFDPRTGLAPTRTISAAASIADARRQAELSLSVYGELKEKQAAVAEEGRNLFRQQTQLAEALGGTSNGLIQNTFAFNNQSDAAAFAQASLANFANTMGLTKSATASTTNAIQAQVDALKSLTDFTEKRAKLGDINQAIAAEVASKGFDPLRAKSVLEELRKNDKEFDKAIKQQQVYDKALKGLNEEVLPKARSQRTQTELERLTRKTRDLTAAVEGFTNTNSKEFQLRFKVEELERVKRDFERLIDLRRELGIGLSRTLPTTAKGAREELDTLDRIKRVRDEILKIRNQEVDAAERLIVAQVAATEKVIDARTRADLAYFESIRARRDAEEQLTADIVSEIRKRETFQKDAVREQINAQAEAYKELLGEQTKRDQDRLKTIARLQLLAGEVFATNPILEAAGRISSSQATQSPVIQRLDKSNDLLKMILEAIRVSGAIGSDGPISAPFTGNLRGRNSKGDAIVKAANTLGVNPADLAAIIGFESAGTYNPNKVGGAGNNFRGLIQFGPEERRQFGVRPGQSFENQVTTSVVKFLQTRFAGVGRSTQGATLEDLYTTVIAGNPNASRTKRDAFGTSARSGAARIRREFLPDVMSRFFEVVGEGVAVPGASATRPRFATATRPRLAGVPDLQAVLASGQLNALSQGAFGTGVNDPRLSAESLTALENYINAQKRANENDRQQIIGQDKLNQLVNVNFKQVEDLAIAEARLARIRSGDAVAVREIEQARQLARTNELTNLEIEIRNLEDKRSKGGRDPEIESLQLQKERLTTINAQGDAEARLEAFRKLASDNEVTRSRRNANVINERVELETRLQQIADERATSPLNQTLREQVAVEDELLRIHKADLEARTNIARISVQLADKVVLHQDQANEKVLAHINSVKSVTDVYADAKIKIVDGVFGGIDKAFDKITRKIPIIGDLLRDLASGITKAFAAQFLPGLLGASPSGPGASSGGGFNIGSLFSGLFGGGGFGGNVTGGTPPFVPGNASTGAGGGTSALLRLLTGGGGGLSASNGGGNPLLNFFSQSLGSAFGGGATRPRIVDLAGATRPRIVGQAGNVAGLFSKAGLGNFVGSIAPLLGLQLGAGLGQGNTGASILGGIGGLLGGGVLTAALAPSLLTGLFGGTIAGVAGAGASAGLGGAVAGLLSNPFTIAAVPLLLGAAFFIGRSKKRRAEEKQRTAILGDSKSKLQQAHDSIMATLRSGRGDTASAVAEFTSQAAQIRQQYLDSVGQLKDKKTRNIAIATVREIDSRVAFLTDSLKEQGKKTEDAQALDRRITPTFAGGGFANESHFTGFGGASYGDRIPAMLSRNEAVLNFQTIANLGGYDALRRAGVKGMDMGGYNSYNSRPTSNTGGNGATNFYAVMVADEKSADEFMNRVPPRSVAKKMRVAVWSGKDDGFINTVERKLAGDF